MNLLSFQSEKNLVRTFYRALDTAKPGAIPAVMEEFCAAELCWRGFHPFNEIRGAAPVGETFWRPLRQSLSRVQRRMDIFMAGQNSMDPSGAVWVASMGHLMGLLDAAWLGIRPTGKMVFLRYCAFHKVVADQIVETAMYFDIPHLMIQAGQNPFSSQTAAHLVQPGPLTHDGMLFADQAPAEGEKTLAAIHAMMQDLGQWGLGLPLEEELARTWHDDMIWWGPAGIGATYTIERYAKQHAGPFRSAFTERSKTNHICRFAEGHFGGFFGWPNFTAVHTGGFLGMPASKQPAGFRVIDIYRRSGDKLAENWIFIDLLHWLNQQGVDLLRRGDDFTL